MVDKLFLLLYSITENKNGDLAVESLDYSKGFDGVMDQIQNATTNQLNNTLIDISLGILSTPQAGKEMSTPGNFDNAKKASRSNTILKDDNLYEKYAEKHNATSLVEVLNHLDKATVEEVDKFVSDYSPAESVISFNTYINNVVNNMTGGKLIGIYANNTTSQAKYQDLNITLKEQNAIYLDGVKYTHLSDIYTPSGELISARCAEFSASSVDNAKDRVLNALMQNPNTADMAGFLARLGIPIPKIGLYFSNPVIEFYNGDYDIIKYAGESVVIDSEAFPEAKDFEPITNAEIAKAMQSVTAEQLALSTRSIYVNPKTGKLTFRPVKGYSLRDIVLAHNVHMAVYGKIAEMSKALSELTQISRADSPNGAIDITLAGAMRQMLLVKKVNAVAFTKEYPFDGVEQMFKYNFLKLHHTKEEQFEYLSKCAMPRLQAFYSYGIGLPLQKLGDFFPQLHPTMIATLDELCRSTRLGVLSKKQIQAFYDGLIQYALGETELGEDFLKNYNYYANQFPIDAIKLISEDKEISKIPVFKKLVNDKGRLSLKSAGRLSQVMRDTLMGNIDQLCYLGTPNAIKLCTDLFKYEFYTSNLKFGPNSIGSMFSANFYNHFPKVLFALRNLNNRVQDPVFLQDYIKQFKMHNLPSISPKITQKEYSEVISVGEDLILVKDYKVKSLYGGSFDYINYNGVVYAKQEADSKEPEYTLYRVIPTIISEDMPYLPLSEEELIKMDRKLYRMGSDYYINNEEMASTNPTPLLNNPATAAEEFDEDAAATQAAAQAAAQVENSLIDEASASFERQAEELEQGFTTDELEIYGKAAEHNQQWLDAQEQYTDEEQKELENLCPPA